MILKRKKKQEKKSKSKKEFKKEIIKNEETEDEFEKIDLGVWKKIFKTAGKKGAVKCRAEG